MPRACMHWQDLVFKTNQYLKYLLKVGQARLDVLFRSLPHLSPLGLSDIQVAESQAAFLSALLMNAGQKLCPLCTGTDICMH